MREENYLNMLAERLTDDTTGVPDDDVIILKHVLAELIYYIDDIQIEDLKNGS